MSEIEATGKIQRQYFGDKSAPWFTSLISREILNFKITLPLRFKNKIRKKKPDYFL